MLSLLWTMMLRLELATTLLAALHLRMFLGRGAGLTYHWLWATLLPWGVYLHTSAHTYSWALLISN